MDVRAMPEVVMSIVPTVVPEALRENDDTTVAWLALPSSRLTPLKEADVMMLIRLACWAEMSVCTWVGSVPEVCAVTTSFFILFSSVIVLFKAAVAVPTTEEPRFRASVTADRAPVSDFIVVEMDQ